MAELEEVVVTASAGEYLPAKEITSGLKSDVPLSETPQAISIISKELIIDQGGRQLEEVLRNVSGVSIGGDYSAWDYYRIRGFDASADTTIDGLYGPNGTTDELWGMERVEVIKGPASSLYGQGSLGGFVNLVSKRPYDSLGGELKLTGGSWDFFESAVDVNLPLWKSPHETGSAAGAGAEKSEGVYLRLNALHRHENSFIDYAGAERAYFAPSILWQIDSATSLTFLASYKQDWISLAHNLPAAGTIRSNPNGELPRGLYVGNPADPNTVDTTDWWTGIEFDHRFSDAVQFRQKLRYTSFDQNWRILQSDELLADQRTLVFYGDWSVSSGGIWQSDSTVDVHFETGRVKHHLITGLDYTQYRSHSANRYSLNQPELDLFNPDYGAMEKLMYDSPETSFFEEETYGVYVQDHIKLPGQVTLTLGGRYDVLESEGQREQAFTPRAGVTYEVRPGWAAYINYSESFRPQGGMYDQNGGPLPPEYGENWETGLKFNLFEEKWVGLISIYQLTQQNIAISNLKTADPFDATAAGEQRSRGFEFETQAELRPGLQLSLAYGFTQAEVTDNSEIPVGARLPGVPDHAFNLWLKYVIREGPLKGLGAGFGTTYYSSQAVDYDIGGTLPAYGILNAALYYQRDQFNAQINFNNLADKRHFVGGGSDLYIRPGNPFNVMASGLEILMFLLLKRR